MTELEDDHRRALELAVGHYFNSQEGWWIDGRVLRRAVEGTSVDARVARLRNLVPEFIQEAPQDRFAPSLSGALNSKVGPRLRTLLSATVTLLKRKFADDPAFLTFTATELADELKDRGEPFASVDEEVVHRLLILAGLTKAASAPGATRAWQTPATIEYLADCQTEDEALESVLLTAVQTQAATAAFVAESAARFGTGGAPNVAAAPVRFERNRAARSLLAYFYEAYEQVGSRSFSITPTNPTALADLGMRAQDAQAAMERLIDKGLAAAFTLGGACTMTELGVDASEDGELLARLLPVPASEEHDTGEQQTVPTPDPTKVFIIHGRHLRAKNAVEHFVRSLGLEPIDFDELAADMGTAFVGEIVREGMARAQGIIALFTPDEFAILRPEFVSGRDAPHEKERWQSRPNVIFEAGMAFGSAPQRTILAVLGGETSLFSDVSGVHLTYLSNSIDARRRLRQKLIGTRCIVNTRADTWTDPARSGDFDACALAALQTASPFSNAAREPEARTMMGDADAKLLLASWLSELESSDNVTLEWGQIDASARVPSDSARRLLAEVLAAEEYPTWRIVTAGEMVVRLESVPQRTRNVR